MERYLLKRGAVLVLVFLLVSVSIWSATPYDELWMSFLTGPSRTSIVPEDDVIGPLANRRYPDPLWTAALSVCDRVFDILREGKVPSEFFLPDTAVPLEFELSTVLSEGVFVGFIRYGRPLRNGDWLDVPVRIYSDEASEAGRIYLRRADEEWLLEQWTVNLSPFIESGDSSE